MPTVPLLALAEIERAVCELLGWRFWAGALTRQRNLEEAGLMDGLDLADFS